MAEALVCARSPTGWRSAALASTRRWVAKGAWAITDQALFALSNFGINILLARWLRPEEYGAFTLAYSIFLVLGTVHSALLADPMIVFGAGKYRDRLSAYVEALLRAHWLLTANGSVVLGIAAICVAMGGNRAIAYALLALAVANPFILLLWLMRRSCYIRVQPNLAASGGLVYMTTVLAAAYLLFRADRLTSPSALLVMGGASLISALWVKSRL